MGDREDVVAIEEQWPKAIADRDRAWLERHTAEDFVFVRPDGVLIEREAYLARTEIPNDTILSRINKADRVSIVGETAVLIGRVHFVVQGAAGGASDLRYRYTSVYTRIDGTWRASVAQLTTFSGTASEWGEDLVG